MPNQNDKDKKQNMGGNQNKQGMNKPTTGGNTSSAGKTGTGSESKDKDR